MLAQRASALSGLLGLARPRTEAAVEVPLSKLKGILPGKHSTISASQIRLAPPRKGQAPDKAVQS